MCCRDPVCSPSTLTARPVQRHLLRGQGPQAWEPDLTWALPWALLFFCLCHLVTGPLLPPHSAPPMRPSEPSVLSDPTCPVPTSRDLLPKFPPPLPRSLSTHLSLRVTGSSAPHQPPGPAKPPLTWGPSGPRYPFAPLAPRGEMSLFWKKRPCVTDAATVPPESSLGFHNVWGRGRGCTHVLSGVSSFSLVPLEAGVAFSALQVTRNTRSVGCRVPEQAYVLAGTQHRVSGRQQLAHVSRGRPAELLGWQGNSSTRGVLAVPFLHQLFYFKSASLRQFV